MDLFKVEHETKLPPSAQCVLLLLEDGTARTFKQMAREAEIAPRTIRYALKRLKESDLIVEKFNFRDARQILYQKKSVIGDDEETSPAMAV
jgi:predicted transcriptional regulator